MAYVMKYETWMEQTKLGLTKPRSDELKAIDEALKAHDSVPSDDNLRKLRIALHKWKMSKGFGGSVPAWKSAERNRKGAVELLDQQVHFTKKPNQAVLDDLAELPFYGVESLADEKARDVLRKAREQALQTMFAGKRLTPKKAAMLVAAQALKSKLGKVKSSGQQVAAAASGASKAGSALKSAVSAIGPVKQAREMADGLIAEALSGLPVQIAHEAMGLINHIIPNFAQELAAAMLPYVSVATSTAKAVKSVGKAVNEWRNQEAATGHLGSVGAGNPRMASEAIIRLIKRARDKELKLAAIYGTDAAVKGAAIAADAATFGVPTVSSIVTPLQGLVTSLALLGITIRAVAMEVQEHYEANRMLAMGSSAQLTGKIFLIDPLLGCYFIAASTHSDIINFAVENIGEKGSTLDIEIMMKNHVHPLRDLARRFILESRYEIVSLANQQGAAIAQKQKLKQLVSDML